MVWTKEKEKRLHALYLKHKGTPLEKYVLNIEYSVYTLYQRDDYLFWSVLKSSLAEQKAIYQRRVKINRYMYGMFDTFALKDSWHWRVQFGYPECELYLVTLTYRDDVLAHSSLDTIKTYVRKFLARNCVDYMACIDFGKKHGRVHFHAVCAISSNKLTYATKGGKTFLQFRDIWSSGFHNITRVNNFKKQYKYSFKASSYAFKNASSEFSPFHKRGVQHCRVYNTDSWKDMMYLDKELERQFSCLTPSGFEVAEPKKVYNTPMLWVADYTLDSISAVTRAKTETIQTYLTV